MYDWPVKRREHRSSLNPASVWMKPIHVCLDSHSSSCSNELHQTLMETDVSDFSPANGVYDVVFLTALSVTVLPLQHRQSSAVLHMRYPRLTTTP